jgi:hypothetical protein
LKITRFVRRANDAAAGAVSLVLLRTAGSLSPSLRACCRDSNIPLLGELLQCCIPGGQRWRKVCFVEKEARNTFT